MKRLFTFFSIIFVFLLFFQICNDSISHSLCYLSLILLCLKQGGFLRIEQIFTQAYVAQGTASATYNAQNIGAGKLERVREGFRASHFIGIVYSVVVGSFLFFAGKYFAYLFISDNIKEVLPMVAIYVKCVALFFIPLYFVNVLRNGIQGMGYGLLPMMAGVAELAGRGITATIAAGKSSYIGTCLASPVAWIFASVLLWVMYFYVMKDMARKLYGTNKL